MSAVEQRNAIARTNPELGHPLRFLLRVTKCGPRESRGEKEDWRFINEAFRNKAGRASVLLSSRVERTARGPCCYRADLPNGSARVPPRERGVFGGHERGVGTRYIRCSCPLASSFRSILPFTLFFSYRAILNLSFKP